MKNLKTPLGIIGLLYLIFGTVINIYLFISQAYPTYLFFIIMGVGLFLLLINGLTKKLPYYQFWQLLIGIAPVLIGYLYFQSAKPSVDVFLVPENFRGVIAVIYDIEGGQKEELEDGKRIYRIPRSGILKTQSKIKNGSVSFGEYYYVTKDNQRIKIKRVILSPDLINFPDSTNSYIHHWDLNYLTNGIGKHINYQQAVVGTKKDTFNTDISERVKNLSILK